MGVTATAAAKQNKLRITREWKANERTTSDKFKQSEQMSRDRHNQLTKLSRAFVRAYPNEFKTFLLARSRGAVARQSFGQPRYMVPQPIRVPQPITLSPIQLSDFKSVSSSPDGPFGGRRIPTAQQN
jgi:hypothetical protein